MDLSLVTSYLNLFTAPLLFTLAISPSPTPMYFLHRLGLGTLALGLFGQSFVVFVELDQLRGWGQLWALKDIGCFILAFSAVWSYGCLAVYKMKKKTVKGHSYD